MRRSLSVLAFLLMASVAQAQPYSPPAGSPTADNEHPRLIVTNDNRAAILSYINTNYRTEFQAFLDRLDTPPGSSSAEIIVEGQWGPLNYAFPVALGVDAIKAGPDGNLGTTGDNFTFPTNYDTAAELCTAAYNYATTDITDGATQCTAGAPCRSATYKLQNSPSVISDYSVTTYPMAATQTSYWLPVVLMYDWCHASLDSTQRGVIADAVYEHYTDVWSAVNLLSTNNFGAYQAVTNRWPGYADATLFGIAAWGDTDVLDSTKRQTLYDTFYTLWINRFLWEVDFYNGKAGWFESFDYWSQSVPLIWPAIAAIDTALGTTYAADREFFTNTNALMAAATFPEGTNRATGCGASGTSPCYPLIAEWGDNTFTASALTGQGVGCRYVLMSTGFARFMGFNTDAAVGKWLYNNALATFNSSGCASNTKNATVITNSRWANEVLYFYLFGTEGITPATPTAKAVEMNYGGYIFRGGTYGQDDAYVYLGASTVKSGGHDSYESGNFSLHKNGPLIVHGPGTREGACRPNLGGTVGSNGVESNIIRNKVGIHKGSSDIGWSSDGSLTAHASWSARGIADAVLGPIADDPLHSTGTSYSYVQLDESPMWSSASLMQREFTYLRGSTDHEYLVIFDRANVANTANDPVWHIQVAAQPTCLDGSCTSIRTGAFAADADDTFQVKNEHASRAAFGSYGWLIPATDGTMFVKAVLPADAEMQAVGDTAGDGTLMYQDGDDDGTAFPFSASTCTTSHYDIFGWGRIEIRPGTVGTTNTFLTVIQFGDADTLTSMTPTTVASVFTPGWVVAQLSDPQQDRVVAFAKDITQPGLGPQYVIEQVAQTADHLITNLHPEVTYYVRSGRTVSSFVAPVGVLAFPTVAFALARRRRRVRMAAACLAVVAVVGVVRWVATMPATMAVEVSSVPNGGTPYQADQAGVLSFVTER